jgi:protein-arginine kinase activator protein McsA
MASHVIVFKDQWDFFKKIKEKDPDLLYKMSKAIVHAVKTKKVKMDVFEVVFKDLSQPIVFTLDKKDYKVRLEDAMETMIGIEAYELCADMRDAIAKLSKKRTRKPKKEQIQ